MIQIPKLTDDELEVFRGKAVLIYGINRESSAIYEILVSLNLEVVGFYSDSKKFKYLPVWNGKPVYKSIKNLSKLAKRYPKIVIQNTHAEINQIQLVKEELKEVNIEISPFPEGQILNSFDLNVFLPRMLDYKRARIYLIKSWLISTLRKNIRYKKFKVNLTTTPLFLCMPMKTADYTLNYTLDKSIEYQRTDTQQILSYYNVYHNPKIINRKQLKKFDKVKIITAVRDPISQNISTLYQGIANGKIHREWIAKSDFKSVNERKDEFSNMYEDVSCLFTMFIQDYVYSSKDNHENDVVILPIQKFIVKFNNMILNLYEHKFDKEKGYSIINEGNLEIFVYRLDKLNDVVDELFNWLGVPFENLENGNITSDKWVGESYKYALDKIEFSQEYFERCFEEEYLQHFYTEEDIVKLKKRWESHINVNII